MTLLKGLKKQKLKLKRSKESKPSNKNNNNKRNKNLQTYLSKKLISGNLFINEQ